MLLHTVNKSPQDASALDSCLQALRSPASLLLLENGVYGALASQDTLWNGVPEEVRCYVLKEDLDARGVSAHLHPRFQVVDYAGFVNLCATHSQVISWY